MPTPPARPRAWVVFLVTWALFTVLSALWAIATPPGASPDEPAHMVKAASVVRGAFNNAAGDRGSEVDVPQYVAWTHAQTCPAFRPDVTAACIEEPPGDDDRIVDSTTTAGRYNPVYYLLVGWPTLLIPDAWGIYAMRIVSAAIVSVFLALTATILAGWSRRMMPVIAFGAGVTPMMLFLTGSVNPNALEVAGTLAAFTAIAAVILRPDPALLAQRATIAAVAAVFAANTRAISPLWVAIAVLLPLLLASRDQLRTLIRSRPVIIAAGVIAAGAAAALLWLRLTNTVSTSTVAGGEAPDVPYAGSSPLFGIALMLLRFGQHLNEMIGVFGWLDTGLPVEVYALWGLLFGSLVVWAIALLRGRALAFALAAIALVPIVPALIQGAFITSGGWIWQGRYALPVLVVALLGLGLVLAGATRSLSARTAGILTGLAAAIWVACHVLAYITSMQRYSVGAGVSWWDMLVAPEWQPPGGIVPLLTLFALVTAGAGALGWRFALPRDVTPRA